MKIMEKMKQAGGHAQDRWRKLRGKLHFRIRVSPPKGTQRKPVPPSGIEEPEITGPGDILEMMARGHATPTQMGQPLTSAVIPERMAEKQAIEEIKATPAETDAVQEKQEKMDTPEKMDKGAA